MRGRVGPAVAARYENINFVDVCPEQGFVMKNLVLHLRFARKGRGEGRIK